MYYEISNKFNKNSIIRCVNENDAVEILGELELIDKSEGEYIPGKYNIVPVPEEGDADAKNNM